MTSGTDPFGGPEIADLLEVKRGTVRIWIFREVFPKPDYPSVNGMPAWRRSTVIRWASRTGRLPASLAGEPGASSPAKPDSVDEAAAR